MCHCELNCLQALPLANALDGNGTPRTVARACSLLASGQGVVLAFPQLLFGLIHLGFKCQASGSGMMLAFFQTTLDSGFLVPILLAGVSRLQVCATLQLGPVFVLRWHWFW